MSDHTIIPIIRIIRNKFDRVAVRYSSEKSTRVKQEFLAECDINNIMARYEKSGQISHQANGQPRYGDFDHAEDYLSATNRVLEAQRTFDALPSRIRDRMENNPANLIAFMDDPENLDEAVELGLVIVNEPERDPVPEPEPTPPVAPPAAPPEE